MLKVNLISFNSPPLGLAIFFLFLLAVKIFSVVGNSANRRLNFFSNLN